MLELVLNSFVFFFLVRLVWKVIDAMGIKFIINKKTNIFIIYTRTYVPFIMMVMFVLKKKCIEMSYIVVIVARWDVVH